jgi:hypothetical protein
MNRLPLPRKTRVLNLLVNGNSLGTVCRLEDVSLNAVTKLLLDVGRACSDYQDGALRNLPCKHIEVHEIWSFRRNSCQSAESGHVWAGPRFVQIQDWFHPGSSGRATAKLSTLSSLSWQVGLLTGFSSRMKAAAFTLTLLHPYSEWQQIPRTLLRHTVEDQSFRPILALAIGPNFTLSGVPT